jgi:hypothetical protein
MKVSKLIMAEVSALPEATPIYAKALLHLGSRAAVDQALSRLTRRGKLVRVSRGLYMRPIETRFGSRTPSVAETLRAIEKDTGETITPSGAATANILGLTTQVPVRTVYLTSGPSRRLRLGAQTVTLQHAPRWQLALPGHPSGDVVRALAWVGRERGGELMSQMSRSLSRQTMQELLSARGQMPAWMAEQISELATYA